ncbi:UNVERIFIED_CONTAM: hypothetical protein Sangu_0383300 [Sesamum angustifolium]|uniref:Uncharacterized protein n=1 Tax=Sesamum angustifolium TaxID=2727405 RepID=A0AAW2QSR4_9LAMI
MAWGCFSEDDLDHILGEAEAKVKDGVGQARDAADEERAPDASLPQPGIEDIPGLSGEASS